VVAFLKIIKTYFPSGGRMKEDLLSLTQWAQKLTTSLANGLSKQAAAQRLKEAGFNAIPPITRSFFTVLKEQLMDPMKALVVASGVIIFLTGNAFDAAMISGIFLLNTIIGVSQELRISGILEKIRSLEKSYTAIIRDSVRSLVESFLIVPGDLIIVQRGERIPADAYVVEAWDFSVDESMLTGESEPVFKEAQDKEQKNPTMIYAGTYVLSGYCKALVCKTGKVTRLGLIHDRIETTTTPMPLQKDLEQLLELILGIIIAICVLLLVIGVLTGRPFAELLAAVTALFICVVPQGVPIIMTLALVSGAYRSARRKVFAKRLQAVEGLGRVTVVVIDKTGTLTRNELMVTRVVAGEYLFEVSGLGYFKEGAVTLKGKMITLQDASPELLLVLSAGVLLDASELVYNEEGKTFTLRGDPTQAAMGRCGQKMGIDRFLVAQEYSTRFEIPFSSIHQYHASFFETKDSGVIFLVGSPEQVSARCAPFTKKQKQLLQELLSEGLRVIAVATRVVDKALSAIIKQNSDYFQKDLQLVGFYGMSDSLRIEASSVIHKLRGAGIRVVMATGDNEETARHVAAATSFMKEGQDLMEGTVFRDLSDEDLLQKLSHTSIFSRMYPEDKVRLVQLYQKQGEQVAMLGDGVNDAPALAAAQIGIAMGASGADVTKQAADIVLMDDSFTNVLDGVEQGRHIFMSFKRVVLYFFTTNCSEILVMVTAFAFRCPLPFLASHLLWMNLVTDGFLDAALAMEPQEAGLLKPDWLGGGPAKLITPSLVLRIAYQSVLVASFSSALFFYYYQTDLVLARTMAMVSMTACQWVMALHCRSLHRSLFQMKFFANTWLIAALGSIVILLLGILYTPWGQNIFSVVPLSIAQWQIIGLLMGLVFVSEELRKWVMRRR